jgi:hypothetical protein
MAEHNSIISKVVDNQVKINETLQLILYNQTTTARLVKHSKFAQYLTITIANIDGILQELIRIENMLAFIHSSSPHHSMISINILRNMIEKLITVYGRDHILELELREYYDLIKPGYYYSGEQIVITFKLPIFTTYSYDLYKLSIAPNKFGQVLIPPYPLIATNRKGYVYVEAECPKYNNWYLCGSKMDHQLRELPDCTQNLIRSQHLDGTCDVATVKLSRIAMEELDEKHYVISFPNTTRIHTKCGKEDYNLLNGSYLVTIPKNCFLYTPEFTITNTNDQVGGQPLKIMKIFYNNSMNPEKPLQLSLNSIDLRKLHSIQQKITTQHTLHPEKTYPDYIYHTTIPFYLIVICMLGFVLSFIAYRYKTLNSNIKNGSHGDKIYEDMEKSEAEKPKPAIFSHLKRQK